MIEGGGAFMESRKIKIFNGMEFDVPRHVVRIDIMGPKTTHGWQVRYGKPWKFFSDHSVNGTGAKQALANAIEAQNPHRRGHGQRVANYAVDMAKEAGLHGRELELIGYAALLHDIGMLGVDEDSLDHILEQISARGGEAPHAIIGSEILEQVDFLKDAAEMVRKHHSPMGKARRIDNIPIGARIINVASHFDKLTKADTPDERLTAYQAISKIKKEQGITFDPKAVRALINVLRKQGKLMEFVS